MAYTLEDLLIADARVASGRCHIARQRRIVEALADRPDLLAAAKAVLEALESAQRERERHQAEVSRQLVGHQRREG